MKKSYLDSKHGFTLIEAIFAVLVASMVLTGVFSYFTDSMRGVAHSEDTLDTIREVQTLSNAVRRHLFEMEPLLSPNGTPADQAYEDWGTIPLPERHYKVRVFETTGTDSTRELAVDGTIIKEMGHEKISGVDTFYIKKKTYPRIIADWIEQRGVINIGEQPVMENSFVAMEREVNQPYPAKVREYHLFSQRQHYIFRHYLEAEGENPFNYIDLIRVNPDDHKEILVRSFGKPDKEFNGRIKTFSLTPIFEFAIYRCKDCPSPVMEYVRFYTEISMVFSGQKKGNGPESRTFSMNMRVINPYLNSKPFLKGAFPHYE
jgi:type II secretory pathway pseudopilin PulG